MATVKIKFRPSDVSGVHGTLYFQVIHNCVVRRIKTNYRIFPHEWDWSESAIIVLESDESRREYLLKIRIAINNDMSRYNNIIRVLDESARPYTADDVIAGFTSQCPDCGLFSFMEGVIHSMKSLGRIRTSETYATTLSSFKRFRNHEEVALTDLDSDMVMAYEAWLKKRGISPNTSSFYMRNLRAVYNQAVDKGYIVQNQPFKHVYTGVEKTVKRAVTINMIKRIRALDLSDNIMSDFARDMFLFSFYARGMSFIDMAYLRKNDLNRGVLTYRRRKTGQQLFIKWEKCMQEIVNKYDIPQSGFLLPIINPAENKDERTQYVYAAHNVNYYLKIIGNQLNTHVPLTMYVARHSWASIAKSKKVPISVISEGMGHDSEATTRIYLASLDTMAVDKANSMILKSLGKRS